jgi:hypothetical protein
MISYQSIVDLVVQIGRLWGEFAECPTAANMTQVFDVEEATARNPLPRLERSWVGQSQAHRWLIGAGRESTCSS